MKNPYFFKVILTLFVLLCSSPSWSQYQMEKLNRGVLAIRTGTNNFVSWRWLGNEDDIAFNLYRNGAKVNTNPLTVTNYTDNGAASTAQYYVRSVVGGVEQPQSETVGVWGQNYLEIPLQIPAGGTTPSGENYTYSANDCSVGDVDADGIQEIFVKWDPSNAKDNSQSGYTGNVYIDCYKLNGTRLWRIDLGRNIRAGAHYTQFMVYDFDGDGRAEMACKTADATRDAGGTVIGNANADYRSSAGYVLTGPEFLTMFNGATGRIMQTVGYIPERGSVSSWGDNYGNRVDRFLAGVAYLDGQRPSLISCRGYYTRTVLVAWDWRNGAFVRRWTFDSNVAGSQYAGQGDHSLSIADVDSDNKQEIIYGAMVIDDNGSVLYSTGHGHGDALHVSDFDPSIPGLEVFNIQERDDSEDCYLYSPIQKRILWSKGTTGGEGPGRGVAANITDDFPGAECWTAGGQVSGSPFQVNGNSMGRSGPSSTNFLIYWDGDLARELNNGTTIDKYPSGRLLTPSGCASNNGSKSNPGLVGDILGDWREELIVRSFGNNFIRIYSTTTPSPHKVRTLLHDAQYRVALAWQNTAYNQPPHQSFFLGNGVALPPKPNITIIGDNTPGNVAPTVSVTAPANNAGYTAPANITITANAADSDGTVSNVQFYNGSTLLGSDATSPYSFSWTNVAAGTYTLTARATDNVGALTSSAAVTVIVSAPPAGFTLQAETACTADGILSEATNAGFNGAGYLNLDNVIGSAASWVINSNTSQTVSLNVRYANGSANNRNMSMSVNGAIQVSDASFVSTGGWTTWNVLTVSLNLSAGRNTLQMISLMAEGAPNIDELGFSPTTISAASCTQTNIAPTVSIASPSNNVNFTAPATITLTANAADTDGTISNVQFYNGSTLLGSDATSPYSYAWTNVGAGTYTITARATDNSGAVTTSAGVTVTVLALSSSQFASGADVGWLTEMEASGRRFYDNNGIEQDLLDILKSKCINSIRLRVWVNPAGGWNNKSDVVAKAIRAKNKGFRIMIDFHYSDSWADPGQQNKPAAWANHSISQLVTDVSNHTTDVMNELKANGITPEWVQVGNETNNGMLWEEGRASVNMNNFASLVKSGYDAVKAVSPTSKVIVHISNGYDNGLFRWMFDGLRNNGAQWDIIGMSLYPTESDWASLNSQCLTNMNDMVSRYNTEVMVVEVGMDVNAAAACNSFLTDIIQKTKTVSGGKGLGVFYWEPQCYNGWKGYNKGAFDNSGRPTIAMDAFINGCNQSPTVSITAPLNNASFTAPASITIHATAADADGTISNLQFYNGTTLLGSDATSPYTFTWNNVAAGTYVITARATDNSGAVTNSAAITVTVTDACIPTVIVPYIQIDGGVWTETSSARANAGSQIIFGPQPTTGGSWTWIGPNGFGATTREITLNNILGAHAGNYVATFTNAGGCESMHTFTLTVNQAPTVSITSPANNASFTAPANIIIEATASDIDGTISDVQFYHGATLLSSDATFPYSFTWSNVVAGTYVLTARATDNSGAVTTSSAITIVVNPANVAPTVSITSPVNNASFTAPANIIIEASASDIDGTVSSVEFYYGTTLLGSDATSPYSFTWSNVAAGTYVLTARATDNSGAVTTSTAITVEVSPANVAPTVSITSPVNNASFTAPTNITIEASASDEDGTVSGVQFYQGATLLGSDATSPYSFTWSNVAAGTYVLTARATDNSGAITTSTAITVVVAPANVAPTVSITSPVNNASLTAPTNITIEASASDEDGTVSGVQFYQGATLLGSDATSPYSFTWSDVAAGTYVLTARATDNSGAVTTSSAITIVVDPANVAPIVNITSPANNASFTTPASIVIDATASDADGTVSNVQFYNGNTLLGSDGTSPYSFTWTNVAAGTYTLTARATDNSGAVTASAGITVVVSSANIPPAVSITSPANNASFTSPANITVIATATDSDGTISNVQFYDGPTLLGTDATVPYSINWAITGPGTYVITARATDNSGAVTSSAGITIVVVAANVAPTVSITSPANNTGFIAPASIAINATASDADGTVSNVQFYNGNTLLGSDATSPYSFAWTNVAAGTHTITARATDNSGAVTTSTAITIVVTPANESPTIHISAPANNATYIAPATVSITATAADADGTISKVDFFNGTTLLGTDLSAPYSFTWSNVAAGTYSITAMATDNDGGEAVSSIVSISVSGNQASVITITSPTNNGTVNGSTVTISGTASDPDGDVTIVDYYSGTTHIGSSTGSPFSFNWNAGDGTHVITILVTDSNGGVTSSSVTVTVNTSTTGLVSGSGHGIFKNIYPNPSSEFFLLESDQKIKHLRILNMYGVEVGEMHNIDSGKKVEIGSELNSGTYMLMVEYASHKIEVAKLVKLK